MGPAHFFIPGPELDKENYPTKSHAFGMLWLTIQYVSANQSA